MIEGLLADGARYGSVRDDVPPGELASFCLHALTAAGGLSSQAAALRLVTVALAGLRPRAASEHEPRGEASDHPPHRSGHRRAPASPP
ncbi:hypothetical protein IGX29_06085 [Streptomyces sp. H28]|nr:hypothetical protein [Streptomyces sp. H28]MBD9731398.1 hypothetical protein [Streptomyces sp. H28]MBM7087217.1 hypothetical protein [Streptomyces sp. S12]